MLGDKTMEHTITVAATPEQLFSFFEETLLKDIKEHKGLELDPKKLSNGFTFNMDLGSPGYKKKVEITLIEYRKPYVYYTKTKTPSNTYLTRYTFTPNEKGTEVKYMETVYDEYGKDVTPFGLLAVSSNRNSFKRTIKGISKIVIRKSN